MEGETRAGGKQQKLYSDAAVPEDGGESSGEREGWGAASGGST